MVTKLYQDMTAKMQLAIILFHKVEWFLVKRRVLTSMIRSGSFLCECLSKGFGLLYCIFCMNLSLQVTLLFLRVTLL